MPIPFRDADDLEELGAAAYLKIERSENGAAYLGGLLLINARGEPLEFTYNRVDLPQSFLWRPADLRRHAGRKLAVSLFDACGTNPRLLFCLDDEIAGEVFSQDIEVAIPVGRLSPAAGGEGSGEPVAAPEAVNVFWDRAPPRPDSVERQLFDRLSTHGLLLEPFERALIGLHAVYAGEAGDQFWA